MVMFFSGFSVPSKAPFLFMVCCFCMALSGFGPFPGRGELAFAEANSPPENHTQEKHPWYDIYLSGNRVCHDCIWGEITSDNKVELINRHGVRGYYPMGEILGVEDHSLLHRLLYHSAHHTGPAGKVLCPEAFEDEKHFKFDQKKSMENSVSE